MRLRARLCVNATLMDSGVGCLRSEPVIRGAGCGNPARPDLQGGRGEQSPRSTRPLRCLRGFVAAASVPREAGPRCPRAAQRRALGGRGIRRDILAFSAYIFTMSPRDVLDFFLQVPNPQIRTALAGPPPSDEHPLVAAEASRNQPDPVPNIITNELPDDSDSRK